jgi:ATPase complex subunit ATP10
LNIDITTYITATKDATAQCTLVAISCKDFGAQLLPSWVDPFTSQLVNTSDGHKFQTVRITINEGRIAKILSPLIVGGTKKNVPVEDHERTLLYYGNAEEWRDILRMHNIYTGYVYLVDGIGRVRWTGSGGGDDEEVANMIQCAKELVAPVKKVVGAVNSVGPRVGRRVQQ